MIIFSTKLNSNNDIKSDCWSLCNVVANMFIISFRWAIVKFDRKMTLSSIIDELFVRFNEFAITLTNSIFFCSNDFSIPASKFCLNKSISNSTFDIVKIETDEIVCCFWILIEEFSLLNVSIDWNCNEVFNRRKRIETKKSKFEIALFLLKELSKSTFFSKKMNVFLKNDLFITQFVEKFGLFEMLRNVNMKNNWILNEEICFELNSMFSKNLTMMKIIKSL